MTFPKISVILPVFNCSQFITESVQSIISQTYTNFEFIIIDDCSTDGTYEYLRSLKDDRIKLIRKSKNTGYTISLNIGIELAKGEYIARMDGDDISLTDRFMKQVDFMDKNPDVVVCGGAYKTIGTGLDFSPKISHDEIILEMISKTPFAHPTVFIRNSILKANNIFYEPAYEPSEDYRLWTILAKFGKLANLNDVLIYYRTHQSQTSRVNNMIQKRNAKKVSLEFIEVLSNRNPASEVFCTPEIHSISDLKKYEDVENAIRNTLAKWGIKFSNSFFEYRKCNALKRSLTYDHYSVRKAFNDLKLLLAVSGLIGNKFLFKYIMKSSLFWKTN